MFYVEKFRSNLITRTSELIIQQGCHSDAELAYTGSKSVKSSEKLSLKIIVFLPFATKFRLNSTSVGGGGNNVQ